MVRGLCCTWCALPALPNVIAGSAPPHALVKAGDEKGRGGGGTGIFAALRIPFLWQIGISYGFVKLVR